MKQVNPHIIFDLDGTLIDSKPEIQEAFRKTFTKVPAASPVVFDNISFGATLQTVLEGVYENDAERISKAKKAFSEIYDSSSYENTLLYPGVTNALEQLQAGGCVMHIATNKRTVPVRRILEMKNLMRWFKSVKTTDMVAGETFSKQQMIEQICAENKMHHGYMVGDTIQDIQAGKAAKLITIAVTYGYEEQERLQRENPTFAINSFPEIVNIVNIKS